MHDRLSVLPRSLLAFALVLGLAAPAWAIDLDVTACGTVVPPRVTGILQADLDCGGLDGITLKKRARLDMNGHSISNAETAVLCDNDGKSTRCSVTGPGVIDTSAFGFQVSVRTRMTLTDLDVLNCGEGIFSSSPGELRLTATNVRANGNSGSGIRFVLRAKLTNIEANNNGSVGIYTFGGKLTNVTTNGNLVGLISASRRLKATNVTTNNNTESGMRLFFLAKIVGAEVHGNGLGGVLGFDQTIRLTDASVTGNFYSGNPADIVAAKRPRLKNTTCEYSWGFDSFGPLLPTWGLCSND